MGIICAKVLEIAGLDAYDYVDHIASTYSGNFLDHNIRVNCVFSSYRIAAGGWSQRFGDHAGPVFSDLTDLTMQLIKVNSTKLETVKFPYRASYAGPGTFTDSALFWETNCVVKPSTNGIDCLASADPNQRVAPKPRRPKAETIVDSTTAHSIGLPTQYQPTAPAVVIGDVVRAYVLPGPLNNVGVVS